MKIIKLNSSCGVFRDPETGFQILSGEVVSYPTKIGKLTQRFIQGGGLIIEDVPDMPITQPVDTVKDDDLSTKTIAEMRKAAREMSIKIERTDTKVSLINKIKSKLRGE
jgi:hypothetical protein